MTGAGGRIVHHDTDLMPPSAAGSTTTGGPAPPGRALVPPWLVHLAALGWRFLVALAFGLVLVALAFTLVDGHRLGRGRRDHRRDLRAVRPRLSPAGLGVDQVGWRRVPRGPRDLRRRSHPGGPGPRPVHRGGGLGHRCGPGSRFARRWQTSPSRPRSSPRSSRSRAGSRTAIAAADRIGDRVRGLLGHDRVPGRLPDVLPAAGRGEGLGVDGQWHERLAPRASDGQRPRRP